MLRMRMGIALAALLAAGVACGGGGGGEQAPRDGGGRAVTIQGFIFRPSPLRIKAGETVTWTNRDQVLHTATAGEPGAPTGAFDGTMDGAGRTFEHTFTEPGTYPYFCSRHNSMRGEIIVEPA